MKARPWKCRTCKATNPVGTRKCVCGKARPPKRVQKHMRALDLPHAAFVEANGGYEGCWVCRHLGTEFAPPFVRDHEHRGDGRARGILCTYHNRLLGPRYTPELIRAYAAYLDRALAREQKEAA